MKNYKLGSFLLKQVLLVGFLLFTFNTAFCQWQATMITTLYGSEQEYELYSDLEQYRYEYQGPERHEAVIVNQESNQSIFMLLDEEKVHFTKTDGKLSHEVNPLQSYYLYLTDGQEKEEGFENVHGYNCRKTSIYQNEEKIITKWYADELRITIKLIGHTDGVMSLAIKDILSWKTDPELFTVPENFIEVDQNAQAISR